MACSQSLCPSDVLVLPLSHNHSQTHTDVLHQQCIIFSLQSICLNSLLVPVLPVPLGILFPSTHINATWLHRPPSLSLACCFLKGWFFHFIFKHIIVLTTCAQQPQESCPLCWVKCPLPHSVCSTLLDLMLKDHHFSTSSPSLNQLTKN